MFIWQGHLIQRGDEEMEQNSHEGQEINKDWSLNLGINIEQVNEKIPC